MRSDDLGKTWTKPELAPELDWRKESDAVDVADADVIAAALADPALNRCDSVVQVDGTDTDTKNVDPVVADWAGGP